MSFDEDEKEFREKNSDNRDFNNINDRNKESRNSEDDFFKDEDFEFEDHMGEDTESEGYRVKRIKQRRRRRRVIFRTIGIMFILIVVAVGVVFWGVPWIKSKLPSKVEIPKEERINIPSSLELTQDIDIVIACAGENLLEPDVSSIIFSRYYSIENKLISLCIPVKTLLDIPSIGTGLVCESVEGGMDLLSLTLKNNLGIAMEVDYYILMDIYNVVNKLDGINLELDEEITVKNYDDDSTFELQPGSNLIDGAEAVNFLKYFSGIEQEVLIGDIVKQKLILDAITQKIAGESEEELSANLNLIKDFMDSNLSMEERLKIFSTFSKIGSGKSNVYSLNVEDHESPEGEIFYTIGDISGLPEIFGIEETASEEVTAIEETVDLTVFNGEGTPGLAAGVAELLKGKVFESGKNKYNILEVGNANNFNYNITEITVYSDQSYVIDAADDIKNILGVGNITVNESEDIESDIIIILGADYKANETGSGGLEEADQLVKIIVLNGEGTLGIAAIVNGILEDHFNAEEKIVEMLEPRNADNWNHTKTEITIFTQREGLDELAQQIQDRLGVGIINYSDNNVDNVDISVLLGSDHTDQW